MTSREVSVLSKYFSSLCSAVSDPLQLADELYAERLIPHPRVLGLIQAEDGRESPSSKRHQAAVKLLTAVDMSLSKDATVLKSLIEVLKDCQNDNGITAESVRAMEIDYYAGGEDFVSIQHSRMVLVKHMNNIASVMTDVSRISEELVSRNIITDQIAQDVRSMLPVTKYNYNPEFENANKVLESVQQAVLLDPGKFAVLIGVLKDNPSTDQNVVALMEAEYCKQIRILNNYYCIITR